MSSVQNELVSAFVIRELAGDKRTLKLTGRALPYRPLSLDGTQRNSIEWYPGSPIGTLQVYGAKEEPTTIGGQWKDIFLGEATGHTPYAEMEQGDLGVGTFAVTTAQELARLVDEMRRRGVEVEVTWLNQARRGIIDRFSQKWHTGHDLEWELTFAWVSQAEELSDVPVLDDLSSDITDLASQVQREVDSAFAEAADVANAGSRFATIFKTLLALGTSIQEYTDELTNAIIELTGDLGSGGDTARRVAGILDGIKLKAELVAELVDGTVDSFAMDQGGVSAINSVERSWSNILSIRADARKRKDAAVRLRNLAAREQYRLIKTLDSTVIRVFQARDGYDLRQVSQEFYGTPDAWRGLMTYNNLRTGLLAAGQVVFIPASAPEGNC